MFQTCSVNLHLHYYLVYRSKFH